MHRDRHEPFEVGRLVQAVGARGGRGAWWAAPNPAAIARTEAELVRRAGQRLPAGLHALWTHFNGLVVGDPRSSTPVDAVVDAASLPDLLDRTGGTLLVPADHEALFDYLDQALPGHLLLGATSEVDVLTASLDGAVHVVDIDCFDDGPVMLAPSFEAFLEAWYAADLRGGALVQARRDALPLRMKLYPGHESSLLFREVEPKEVCVVVALAAGVPLRVSLRGADRPTSVVVDVEGEARLTVTDAAPGWFTPARAGDHRIRVVGCGPVTVALTLSSR